MHVFTYPTVFTIYSLNTKLSSAEPYREREQLPSVLWTTWILCGCLNGGGALEGGYEEIR